MSVQRIENYEAGTRACCLAGPAMTKAEEPLVELDVNALDVVDRHGGGIGILTDHDRIPTMVKGDIDSTTVAAGMSTPAVGCEADTPLSDALRLMGRHRIRHLAKPCDDAFVRMFSLKDLLAKIHQDDALEANVLRDLTMGYMVPDA